MAIIKDEDVIGYTDGSNHYCLECRYKNNVVERGRPLTKDDFEETDIVICDECDGRIQ